MKRHHRTKESWERWADLKRKGLPWTILEVTEVTADGKIICGYDQFDGLALGEELKTIEPGKMYKIQFWRDKKGKHAKEIIEWNLEQSLST